MKKILITGLLLFLSLIQISDTFASTEQQGHYGIYYRHGKIFGKMVHYDAERDLAIIYGSLYVAEKGEQWRLVESRKFHLIHPKGNDLRNEISKSIGKTLATTGELQVWPGQRDEVMVAGSMVLSEYPIESPTWYGFGKTQKSERIYKFDLTKAADFVDALAGIQKSVGIPQDKKLNPGLINLDDAVLNAARKELGSNWNEKWCVVKDSNAANDLRMGVGGWQLYEGLAGYGNAYIAASPIMRKDIVEFMDAVRHGEDSPERSGSAAMCAYISLRRDQHGDIVEVTASGVLMESAKNLVDAINNPSAINPETWEVKGWTEKDAETMEDKLCWLSGNRVLVYEEGDLIDQYFSMKNYLTRTGFDNVLDVGNQIIGQGGV